GELAVAEIGFVHDLGDDPEPPVLEAQTLQERFERAVLAVVPELGAEDVEGDPLLGSVGGVRESAWRGRVDEAFDEPRGRNAVDVRSWPGHPRAARGGKRVVGLPRCRPRPSRHGLEPFGDGLPAHARPASEGALEIIDALDPVELALEPLEPDARRLHRRAMRGGRAVQLGPDLAAGPHQRLIFGRALSVKERRQLLITHRVDPVDAHQRRFAPGRLDLLDEPLEELDRLWRLRQDPGRALQLDRPHSLELPPDTDAVPRRRRRQAHQECEPTHSCYNTVTSATLRVK